MKPTSEGPQPLYSSDEIPSIQTRAHVLILQHPQEPDKALGSARLAHLALPNSTLNIGLSWPNLKAALGREASASRWAVLYLGSGIKKAGPETTRATGNTPHLQLVDKKGAPLPESQKLVQELEGIVVLDGTWSQAKALWWRNAWLLKLKRAILVPNRPSLYRELRKEPRRECLSTIESISLSLRAMGESPRVEELSQLFGRVLDRYRAELKTAREAKRKPRTQ